MIQSLADPESDTLHELVLSKKHENAKFVVSMSLDRPVTIAKFVNVRIT